MGNLFLSFSIATAVAASLVVLSRAMDLEFYTSRIFPLIPLFYALVYQALEKARTGQARPIPPTRAKEELKAGAASLFQDITPGRIAAAVGISFAIKFGFEILFTTLYVNAAGSTLSGLYGELAADTVGSFLRGDHPWLSGRDGIWLLCVLVFVKGFGTGLWIGYTAKGQAILEGVIVGALVTLVSTITNILILYRQIEEMANRMAASLGFATHIGFVVVIASQVLLYGFWSGVAQKAKEERAADLALRNAARKKRK